MSMGGSSPKAPADDPDPKEGAADPEEGAAEDAAARPKHVTESFSFRFVMALHIGACLLFLAIHFPLVEWTKHADLSKVKQQLEDVKP